MPRFGDPEEKVFIRARTVGAVVFLFADLLIARMVSCLILCGNGQRRPALRGALPLIRAL